MDPTTILSIGLVLGLVSGFSLFGMMHRYRAPKTPHLVGPAAARDPEGRVGGHAYDAPGNPRPGYFWTPCPLCGAMHSGADVTVDSGTLHTGPGRGLILCTLHTGEDWYFDGPDNDFVQFATGPRPRPRPSVWQVGNKPS